MKKYNLVASGGTFDHFHKGHEAFLLAQLALSDKILLGITSDAYVQQYKSSAIQPYPVRFSTVTNFLKEHDAVERVRIIPLADGDIPSLWRNEPIEAIVVTDDTKKGAVKINERRISEGQKELLIETIPHVYAADGKILSATRIRNGEVDRNGNLWIKKTYETGVFHLPEILRPEMQKPFGQLFPTIDAVLDTYKTKTLLSVGDYVSESLFTHGVHPKVAVVDLFVKREKVYKTVQSHTLFGDETIISVINPAGTIYPSVFTIAQKVVQDDDKHYVVEVSGEEDLVVLPLLLAAPLGYIILYGQPDEGVIAVAVTEEKKKRTQNILDKFDFQPQN